MLAEKRNHMKKKKPSQTFNTLAGKNPTIMKILV